MTKLIILKGERTTSKQKRFKNIINNSEGIWNGHDRYEMRDKLKVPVLESIRMQRIIVERLLKHDVNVVINVCDFVREKWMTIAQEHGAIYEEIDFDWENKKRFPYIIKDIKDIDEALSHIDK